MTRCPSTCSAECRDRLASRDRFDGPPQLLREALREVANEQWNVLRAFPQRRNPDGKHVQPVVQIASELTVLHQRGQIPVRGRDQPDIHVHGACAAEPFEFLFLKDTEQLGLQL